jgi:nucleoside-diphosphate-sugar epimerase
MDWIFHCASPVGVESRAEDVFRVNVGATVDLLDYAHAASAKRFVYLSSGGVVADPLDSAYLMAKHAGELAVRSCAGSIPFAIARLFFPYGVGQERGLVPRLCALISQGEPIAVGRGGCPILSPIHVEDVARVLLAIASDSRPLPIVDLAGRERIGLEALARRLAAELGRPPRFKRDRRDVRLVGRAATAERRYGHNRMSLARGIADFVPWWQQTHPGHALR